MNRLIHRAITRLTVIGLLTFFMYGCGFVNGVPNSSETKPTNLSDHSPKAYYSQPKKSPVHNVVLAKSYIPGRSGQELELVDVSGEYLIDPNPGPTYGGNWLGHFQLQIINSTGKVVSKLSLPDNKYTQPFFKSKFSFHFADYNGDGNPDFTLGQYFGSNGYVYQLYTIKTAGIFRLPVPAPIFAADIAYSPLFQRVGKNGFQVEFYDNSKGNWYRATYTWNGARFVQTRVSRLRKK